MTNSKFALPSILALFFTLVAGCSAVNQTPAPLAANEIRIDTAKTYQTIEGFGASSAWWAQDVGGWEQDIVERIIRLLYHQETGIGLSVYRYNIGGGLNSRIYDDWRTAETFEVSQGVYDWSRDANAVKIMKLAQAAGVKTFIGFVVSPPARLTVSGATNGNSDGTTNLQMDKLDQFVTYMLDIIRHFRQEEGIPIQYLSPLNEPQWNWSPKNGQEGSFFTPQEVLLVTKTLMQAIQASDMPDLKVSVFESGSWKDSPAYIDVLMGDPEVARNLSHLAIHSYWSDKTNKENAAKQIYQKYPDIKLWMTEWTEMKNGRDIHIDSAINLANTLHEDLTITNVTSWQYWIAVSRHDYRDGLIYVDANDHEVHETKRLWAMGNFSRFVLPGYIRVDAVTGLNGLNTSAYLAPDGKDLVIVAINPGETQIQAKLTYPASFKQVAVFETSSANNLAEVMRESAIYEYSFPARSVTTLILTP